MVAPSKMSSTPGCASVTGMCKAGWTPSLHHRGCLHDAVRDPQVPAHTQQHPGVHHSCCCCLLPHRGIVACANQNEPNTNGSQFFITLDKCDWLDRKNTIFGKIVGDTIYNLLKLGEMEVRPGGELLLGVRLVAVGRLAANHALPQAIASMAIMR